MMISWQKNIGSYLQGTVLIDRINIIPQNAINYYAYLILYL